MSIDDIPTIIASDEDIGRRISRRSDQYRVKRSNKSASKIFMPRKGEVRLSMDRLTIAPPGKMSQIAADTISKTTSDRQFLGWAVVSVQDVVAYGLRVVASPIPDNPYHADIILLDDTANDIDDQKSHAVELARLASWCASALLV